jgi:hypothetical protein
MRNRNSHFSSNIDNTGEYSYEVNLGISLANYLGYVFQHTQTHSHETWFTTRIIFLGTAARKTDPVSVTLTDEKTVRVISVALGEYTRNRKAMHCFGLLYYLGHN